MKVQAIESSVWWIAFGDEIRPLKNIHHGVMLEAIQKTFSFAKVPTEYKPGEGVEFHQGTLKEGDETIVISRLVAFTDGLNIVVPSSTEDGDKVLNAALDLWFSLGMREPTSPPAHTYVSSIVVDFDCSIDNFFPSSLLTRIAEAMPLEGQIYTSVIGFNFDPTVVTRPPLFPANPGFRIERREGVPYELNRWFSGANISTEKHLMLLEQIEAAACIAKAN